MNGNVIRTITIQGKAEGVDKVTGDLNKLAAAQENVAVVSEQSAKRVLSLETAWQRQTLRLDEAARAQANIARETKLADQALREGLATQQQYAQRLDQINRRYGEVATSAKQMIAGMSAAGDVGAVASQRMISGMSGAADQVAKGAGLARHELINLSRQAQDVGVQLVSGQSPFMILAQQGSQIADVFLASGKSVGGFFTQAIGWGTRFLASTTGIVTAIGAIGAGAIFAAMQFRQASTTVEEALKEQNRLLKEGKDLIDARTAAETRAQAQPRGLTQFETLRNELDLRMKLNKVMEDTANIARSRAATPSQVPGEMGEAPTGFAPLAGDPGYAKIEAAVQSLNAAIASGMPGLRQFNDTLGEIGLAHPKLAATVEQLLKAGEGGLALEQAALRAKAMADALAGVATNAQLAAVGLGSIAQFKMNNMQAEQAAAATERQAAAVMQLVAQYGNLGPVAAQQAHALEQQVQLTQARTAAEEMSIQYNQTIANADLNKLTAAEALKVATLQRANAEGEANKQAAQTLHRLRGQDALLAEASKGQQETGAGEAKLVPPARDAPRKPDERRDLPAAA